MIIAVGTQNPAKLRAVRQTVQRVWPKVELVSVDVPTGVSDMPMSDAECIDGARNRARAARKIADADLGIGLEGGVNQEPAGLMLLGWVVITHKDGREGIASTARLPLPTCDCKARAGWRRTRSCDGRHSQRNQVKPSRRRDWCAHRRSRTAHRCVCDGRRLRARPVRHSRILSATASIDS